MDIAFNPADYPTYNIGDKVTIRQWDDMASEFGLNVFGDIKVPKAYFTKRLHTNSIRHKKICHEPKNDDTMRYTIPTNESPLKTVFPPACSLFYFESFFTIRKDQPS